MAIVNRTRDSFYDGGVTWGLDQALERVRQAVRDGADLVDIGGVKAGEGPDVSVAEEKPGSSTSSPPSVRSTPTC